MSENIKKRKKNEGPPEGGYSEWEPFDTYTVTKEVVSEVMGPMGREKNSREVTITYVFWRRRQ